MKSVILILLTAATPAASFIAPLAGLNGNVVATSGISTQAFAAPRDMDESITAFSASSRRDMLATTLATITTSTSAILSPTSSALAIETYLTEPTEEFKESERQRLEFRKKQLSLKADFVKVLARLTTESSTEEQIENDLKELKTLVIQTGGLPLGIKKEDMYKIIRTKKAKGFWPTNVEIA
jgi:glutaredoxin 2